MSGQGDDRAGRLIERALAGGPADVLALLQTLRAEAPELLGKREGFVHALLHGLVRRGSVVAGAIGPDGRVRYHAPGGAPAEAAPSAGEAPASVADARARQVAADVRDDAARLRIAADVAAHLADLRARGHEDRFGAVRAARHLLQRVDRGRPSVCLAGGGGDALRRLLLHEGPWVLAAVAVFFVLKLWIVPVYKIPSRSMVPTLQVGDRVAVFLPGWGGVPERWTIVTYEVGGTTYVKRLVGLPGEEFAILHGDVYVDGVMLVKPQDVREAMRNRVDSWRFDSGVPPPWVAVPAEDENARTWTWMGGGFPAHPTGGSFQMRDGYAVLEGERRSGGRLELTLSRGPAGGAQDRSQHWVLEAGPDGMRLTEIHDGGDRSGSEEELAASGRPAPEGAVRMELSYVDGVVRAACGDWHWEGARSGLDAALGLSVGERGPGAGVRRVTLDRDLHYSHAGSLAVPTPGSRALNAHAIPPGHVFCLGDNTSDSRDSRFRMPGDIPVDALIGPVRLRVWPPARWGRVK